MVTGGQTCLDAHEFESAIHVLAAVFDYDRLYGCVELVEDVAGRLDPVSGGDGSESVWIELISENSI
ncbi:hypothetical protein ACFRCG_44210 [Embleya sp. NPDC056575]|uniref:hypothetical protein n=1 Tax=unclassified Embleya TaxID=2699296 RepID=UPI00367BA720